MKIYVSLFVNCVSKRIKCFFWGCGMGCECVEWLQSPFHNTRNQYLIKFSQEWYTSWICQKIDQQPPHCPYQTLNCKICHKIKSPKELMAFIRVNTKILNKYNKNQIEQRKMYDKWWILVSLVGYLTPNRNIKAGDPRRNWRINHRGPLGYPILDWLGLFVF